MQRFKISALALALALSFTVAQAQIKVAAKAGLNLSSWTHSDDAGKQDAVNEGIENYTGFQIGGTIDYLLSDLITLQSGLLFEVRGTKYYYEDPGNAAFYNSSTWNPSYLIIPLHVKATFGEGGSTFSGAKPIVFVYTGPYVGIAVGGKKAWDIKNGAGDPDIGDLPIDWGDGGDLRSSDFGWNIGGGVEIANFQVGVQYAAGLMNINGQSDINKVKQNVINFYLAFTVFNND